MVRVPQYISSQVPGPYLEPCLDPRVCQGFNHAYYFELSTVKNLSASAWEDGLRALLILPGVALQMINYGFRIARCYL